jgi:hypothetical protein
VDHSSEGAVLGDNVTPGREDDALADFENELICLKP